MNNYGDAIKNQDNIFLSLKNDILLRSDFEFNKAFENILKKVSEQNINIDEQEIREILTKNYNNCRSRLEFFLKNNISNLIQNKSEIDKFLVNFNDLSLNRTDGNTLMSKSGVFDDLIERSTMEMVDILKRKEQDFNRREIRENMNREVGNSTVNVVVYSKSKLSNLLSSNSVHFDGYKQQDQITENTKAFRDYKDESQTIEDNAAKFK